MFCLSTIILPQDGHVKVPDDRHLKSTHLPEHDCNWIKSGDPMSVVINASTSAELYAALSRAQGGETILLAEGDYGGLSLWPGVGFSYDFASNVTIASLDPEKPATFTWLNLWDAQNLTLDGVVFDYDYKEGDATSLRPMSIRSSTNISITNSLFDGDSATGTNSAADGYGSAIALSVRGSENITVEGNEFTNWWRALTVENSKNIEVTNNEINNIRSDGMDFVDVQGVLIEDNYIHDFRASRATGDHVDMIQFWTTGTTEPSTDITIRNNVLDIGDGNWTQSIFMRNEMVDTGQAGREMFYRNVLIENNTIYNSHLHGITVGATDGLVIRDNSVLHVPDTFLAGGGSSGVHVPTIRVASNSEAVTVTGNVTAAIAGDTGQADWTVRDNAFVQSTNPFGAGYYGDVFVDSTVFESHGAHNFIVEPGGLIDALGAGSSRIQLAEVQTLGEVLFSIETVDGNAAARVFDASHTKLLTGSHLPDSSYVWAFSDGSTATGLTVTHTFPDGGSYNATLTVKMPDGTQSSSTSSLTLRGSEVVDFDSESGAFRVFSSGEDKLLAPMAALDDGAIQLQRTGTVASVAAAQVSALRGSDDFEINLTLRADQAGSGGEVFRVHGAVVARVDAGGIFVLSLSSSDGKTYALKGSSSLPVNDGAEHDISVRVVDGTMVMEIDGIVAAEASFGGTLPTSGLQGLTFGNPWGKVNFLGDVTAFSIDVDVEDYPGVAVSVPAESAVEAPPMGVEHHAPEAEAEMPALTEPPLETNVLPETSPAPSLPRPISPLEAEDAECFVLDIAALAEGSKKLVDDAAAVVTDGPARIVLDGDKDYVNIGRLGAYEASDKVGFSVAFTRDSDATGDDRLVWNHQRLGLTVNEDSLMIHVATADRGFVNYTARNLDISDEDLHRATVLVDTETDRLQVIYDDEVVLDVTNADFDMPEGYQWGWSLGTAWNRYYDGEIHDFRVGDQFDFVNDTVALIG